MTRIYLDVCCLNRPFDDQTQPRIRLEAEAVLLILERIETGEWAWIGSDILSLEIVQTRDATRRARVQRLASLAEHPITTGPDETSRAEELERLGFHAMDALHLACAESGKVDVFLTTDDRLLRRARRLSSRLQVRVENPLTWLREIERG